MESLLFDIAQTLWWPVTALVLLAFVYAMIQLGRFSVEVVQRFVRPGRILTLPNNSTQSIESLELMVLSELEGLRLCSRVAPMLGLVATMIPLGPALAGVASGDADVAASDDSRQRPCLPHD